MTQNKNFIFMFLMMFLAIAITHAEGFLHTQGKNIVNGAGENIILRGIGTGNWMLMEGYMMQTSGIAGTQHEFRTKLNETIGETLTDSFFNAWLSYHFTKADVDSMKAWGFNSVRAAMHYKWFTPPIEEEAVSGEITWINKGFTMMDSLLEWCSDNEMYLILDLHGAPGGQGKDANISDYDSSKPSLWESQHNKDKTVALWRKLAERYANEPWIGGYDLLNETNWTFPENSNIQMRQLFEDITDAIREVDSNHIIYIEGNSFANDHSGLKPPWDNNLVYSFHKYWSGTNTNDLDWIIALRNTYNVPLWLGESGENSNTWYTDMISLSEKNNIGWSWWPVKKYGINNVLGVSLNESYDNLIKYWKGETTTKPTQEAAFQAVLEWAKNHKIENCKIQYDVIDAMIRQPHSDTLIAFNRHLLGEPIFFSDYDYGKLGIAYNDNDFANYGGEFNVWNTGWAYRNDGVDIESCDDTGITNGFNVGWTNDEEWMNYTIQTDSMAAYTLNLRHASGAGGSQFHIEANGIDISGILSLPGTGGWQEWQSTTFENIILPKGKIELKFEIDKGGSNLNYFQFNNPTSVENIAFEVSSAETDSEGTLIYITLNKPITSKNSELLASDFTLNINGVDQELDSIYVNNDSPYILILVLKNKLYSDNSLKLSYSGTSVLSESQMLSTFMNLGIYKNMPTSLIIPGKIQAENFIENNGFELEDCQDSGGGENTSFANRGDYLTYHVHVTKTGYYRLIYRVATERSNAELVFQIENGTQFISLDTMKFTNTGGWQTWKTQFSEIYLTEGYYSIRLHVKQGEHNLNWFQLNFTSTANTLLESETKIIGYPNPANDRFIIKTATSSYNHISIHSLDGYEILNKTFSGSETEIDTSRLNEGIYLVRIYNKSHQSVLKLIITHH